MKPGWRESIESTAQGLYPTVRVPYDVFVAYPGRSTPRLYRGEFRLAFEAALQALPARELTIDELASLYPQ